MPHAILRTSISFGLVNIPVKVYSAIEEGGVHFSLLCGKCHTPLHYKRWCEKCKKEIPWENVVKGYEVTKDRFIPLTKEELEGIRLRSAKTIEIAKFVDRDQIDPIFWGFNYYLVPDNSAKAYSLFKDVLNISGKVAIGHLVMKNKEHLVAIWSYKKGLVMTDLHYPSEIRNINELEELKHLVVVRDEELRLAQALVAKLKGEFRPKEYKDRYKTAVMKLIKEKIEGKPVKAVKEKVRPTKDLMAALKASIKVKRKLKKEK